MTQVQNPNFKHFGASAFRTLARALSLSLARIMHKEDAINGI